MPVLLGASVSVTNSLAKVRPALAVEWHPAKNGTLEASDVLAGSARLVWWRCRLHHDHEWCASVCNRARGSGCPLCAGRRASVRHCLAVAHPELAREWHPRRNGTVTPESVTPRTQRVVWWRCSKGHDWQAPVIARTRRRSGCPACSRRARDRKSNPAMLGFGCRPASATDYLREQHRQTEQVLALLGEDTDVDSATIVRVVGDMRAHLKAEETLLYPIVERAWNRPLSKQRELHRRMHLLLSKLAAPLAASPAHGTLCKTQLSALRVAFREHARLSECAALPWLEGSMSPAALGPLRRQLADFQDANGASPRTATSCSASHSQKPK